MAAPANDLAQLTQELEHSRAAMQALMKHVGVPALCKGCGARILWIYHQDTSRNVPYDADGINHFATCPKAAEFKKRGIAS